MNTVLLKEKGKTHLSSKDDDLVGYVLLEIKVRHVWKEAY